MSDNERKKTPTYNYDRTKYIKVVCRLCGSEWLYPKQYEKLFDAEHPLENCAYCKRYMGVKND